jgi:DNA invertase Pin-like site-specific DNA recombinase
MKIGYARTSTAKQDAGLCAQLDLLERVEGIDREHIYHEQVSSVQERAQLDAALRALRKGDTLVVTKLDRFARSIANAISLERKIAAKDAALKILDPAIDTATPTGRLMFNMFGAIAQFEREIMLERQREGIARAQSEGKYRGRQPTARAKSAEVKALAAEGVSKGEIVRRLGISRASVFRILGDKPMKRQA